MRYRFGDHILDVDRRELHRDGAFLTMEPQVFDLLVHLLHNRERVVGKDELIKHVWRGRSISDATLDSRVRSARLAVGDTGTRQSVIRTIPRRGVRFVADVAIEAANTTAASPLAAVQLPLGASKPSILVLPFVERIDDRVPGYFSDGIEQGIIAGLTRSRMARVLPGGSIASSQGDAIGVMPTDVDYALETYLHAFRGRVRVAVRLIDTANGCYIWAESFDRRREEILTAHADIANAICGFALRAIATNELRLAIRMPRADPTAWRAYQQGMWIASSHGRQEINQAMTFFRQAAELDPSFAEPHALLSRLHLIETHRGDSEVFHDALARAETEAIAALRLDPGYSTAHAVLSGVLDYHGDQAGALEEAERGIALNSEDPWSWFSKGHLLVYGGRWAEGRAALNAALRLQPGGPIVPAAMHHLIVGHFMEHDFAAAEAACRQIIRSQPAFERPHVFLAASLGHLGRLDEAAAVLRKAMSFSSSYLGFLTRGRPPYFRPDDYDLVIDGFRKAGWCGDPGAFATT